MERILVVEDDLALNAGLCFELDTGGYSSAAAYTYAKARYLVREERFSLVLLDVNLPDGNGFDLCREIKELRPELPVIFLTANDLEEDVLSGFDMGAEDYVTKPFNMKILLRRRKAGHHPQRIQASEDADGEFRADSHPPASFGASLGQRRKFHR